MEHPPVKVEVGYFDVAHLKTSEAAAIEQPDEDTVFEQLGNFEQAFYLFSTEYHGKFLAALDGGQFDAFVLQAFDAVGKSEGIDGELKIGIRWGVVLLFDQIEVIVNLVWVHFGWYLVEMERKLGKVPGVVGKGTGAFSRNSDFLAELLVKFTKTCYIGTGCFDKVCFFFMIERNK